MIIRRLALATAALALLLCGSAPAAPTTVQLRIEGSTRTVFEGPVTTDGKTITKGGNTIACDGTLNGANADPGPTATSALDDAALGSGFDWDATFFGDFFIDRIADVTSTTWGYAVNFQPAQVGGCQQRVQADDEVLFASEFFGGPNFAQEPLLRLDGPPRAVAGQPFTVKVTDGQTGAPFASAAVGSVQTAADGAAALSVSEPGLVQLKADAQGAIRSNGVNVCVSATGTGDCGVPSAQLGGPGAAKRLKDSVTPRVRIGGPRDGRHYRRGPRLLRGTAADDVGVAQVKLALRRHVRGQKCRWWSGSRERFAGNGCARKVFFQIDGATSWSYLLPRRLTPGRYVLDVKAFDRVRNRDERFVRGTNRVVFYVGRGYGARAAASAKGRPRARPKAARVNVLVAGRAKSSSGAVRARATLVRVGGRTCKVGASTPLAALAVFLRAHRTGYLIRDYGSCSRTNAAAAGQLFVRRIGKDSNHGNDGWFYKRNDSAPEIGAGDPAARLREGDRLLWFYCVFDEQARSCQRSLRVVPDTGGAAGALRVTVRGYDNAGHWTPVAGASVVSGAVKAVSGADGIATLVPRGGPGPHRVTATRQGMIDAFPTTVTVK
jgi:hypothetical protein